MGKQKAQKWVNKKKNNEVIDSVGSNLTGHLKIEDFERLKSIRFKKHKITGLEISRCLQLSKIDLSELTELTSLSVIGCPELISLGCYGRLERLHLSNDNKLKEINCRKNQLTELDVSDCPSLTELD